MYLCCWCKDVSKNRVVYFDELVLQEYYVNLIFDMDTIL